MVLLKGLNYDYSGQVSSKIATAISSAGTSLVLDNTEGFAADDYILIQPKNEIAEIVKITSVTNATTLVIGAVTFAHAVDVDVFRIQYNQMKFYSCATLNGTYVVIASSTTNLDYSTNYTNFEYPAGTSALYYKRTFYNSNDTYESDIDLSEAWQISDEDLYITPEQLRTWMQFDNNDPPNREDMKSIISLAQDKMSFDVSSSDSVFLRIALYLLSRSMVLRALAAKSLSKGYITINAEGRQVTKATEELVLEAENTMNEYQVFVRNVAASEVTSTNFLTDTASIDSVTRQQIIDNWTGAQNGMDQDNYDKVRYGRRIRY